MTSYYITYFDLLGTRGMCEDPDLYYENIDFFYDVVQKASFKLQKYGKVGVFSDCAYAESSDLSYLLDFLVMVQERLMAKGLYFNAAVKSGKLGIQYKNVKDNEPFFGIRLTNNIIADLYLTQANFKGVGINISPEIAKEMMDTPNFKYKTVDCIYIYKSFNSYEPRGYKDIALPETRYEKSLTQTLEVLFETMYSSYIKRPKFGLYYISLLSNMLRSYGCAFNWDMSKDDPFLEPSVPIIFKSVKRFLDMYETEFSDLEGGEYLALVMLDVIYNLSQFNEEEKKDITMKTIEISCVKNKFIHELNTIPNDIFTINPVTKTNNKNTFIQYCQKNLSKTIVDNIVC